MTELRPRARTEANARRRRRSIVIAALSGLVALVAAAGISWAVTASHAPASAAPTSAPPPASATIPNPTLTSAAAPATAAPPAEPPAFDKAAHSIDDPTSIWFIVNKGRGIPDAANYVPPDLVPLPADMPNPNGFPLRAEAAAALETMFQAARAEIDTQLVAQSGYRSYDVQVNAYNYYVNSLGTSGADLTSARPGFSEHQTGMAIDIMDTVSGCSLDGPCFGDTTSGKWLVDNSHRFGFILRYPADKTAVTGYEYEPWHFRYVGVDLSTEMHDTGITTLEEFFGLPATPTYPN